LSGVIKTDTHDPGGSPMFIDWAKIKIYIRTGYTDMRKQINGLAVIVQENMKLNPYEGNLYLFSGKTRRRLKALYWDRNGFCMWTKKLGKDRFPWPQRIDEVKAITEQEFRTLLDGIDFFKAHKELFFSEVI
jgi:transposase